MTTKNNPEQATVEEMLQWYQEHILNPSAATSFNAAKEQVLNPPAAISFDAARKHPVGTFFDLSFPEIPDETTLVVIGPDGLIRWVDEEMDEELNSLGVLTAHVPEEKS